MADLWPQFTKSVVVTRQPTGETRDGEGGWNLGTAPTVYSGLADMFISRTVSEARDEANPGINTEKVRQFKFLNPVGFSSGFSAFQPQDRIAVGGEVYTVRFVRQYSETTVVEGWIMNSGQDS